MGCYQCKYNQTLSDYVGCWIASTEDVCMLYMTPVDSPVDEGPQVLDEAIDCQYCNADLTHEEMDSILKDYRESIRSVKTFENEELPF